MGQPLKFKTENKELNRLSTIVLSYYSLPKDRNSNQLQIFQPTTIVTGLFSESVPKFLNLVSLAFISPVPVLQYVIKLNTIRKYVHCTINHFRLSS